MSRILEALFRFWWRVRVLLEPVGKRLPWVRDKATSLAKILLRSAEFLLAMLGTVASIFKKPLGFLLSVFLKNKLAGIVIIFGIALIFALLTSIDAEQPVALEPLPEDRPDYQIGAIISLTGSLERLGTDMRRGYETAIRAYNDTGGIRIGEVRHNLKLVIFDDESNPVRAGEVAQLMFAQEKPHVLLGPYSSSLSKMVVTIAVEQQVPVVLAIASSAGLTDVDGIFMLQTPPQMHLVEAAKAFTTLVRERKGQVLSEKERFANGPIPRVVISSATDPHSLAAISGVRDELSKIDEVEIVEMDLSLPDEQYDEQKESLDKIDAMFVSSYAQGAHRLMGTVATEGINIPFLAMTHCDVASIVRLEPTAAEGVLCPLHWQTGVKFPGSAPFTNSVFEKTYYETYGTRPSHHAAASAAAIQVIANALRLTETSELGLAEAIAATDMDTFYGPVRFDDNGRNTAKPMVLSQVTQSRFVPVAPQQLAETPLNFTRPTLAEAK